MSINTPHNVTLTEGQIGVILCILENYMSNTFDEYIDSPNLPDEVDTIFEELEGVVDRYYDKVEKAQAKQPTGEW